ncbi:MAG: fibronectin type III domain-containing protein, partial [Planctomycetaceae bacterium]|nr:fibronectin type III domain-containing protein [Planctomycetaceae bacterium]
NLTEDVYLGHCYIHGNGINASAFEHNSYCECNGIVYEYNRYGPLRSGANGNALKDRSANCVVRYNWIESGNRQLDLVEADGSGIETLAGYNTTYVYGNVLIEPNGAGNSQILHYGGDNGNTATYRKGTLYFYGNTIVSTRTGNTTLMRLSTNSETCDCRNNIIYVSAAGSFLGLIDDTGVLNYRNNWLKTGYSNSHSGGAMQGTVNNQGGNVVGTSPGFLNEAGQDFSLAAGSTCINAGIALAAAVLPTHNVTRHYVKHQQGQARPVDATFDLGAFEAGSVPTTPPNAASGLTATANMTLGASLNWSDNSSDESGFRIERQIGAASFATLTTVGANVTSYNDSGLTLGTMYTYRIVAYNAAGDAAPSNTSSITAQGTAGGGGGGTGSSSGSGGGGGCAVGEGLGALALLGILLLRRRR